MNSELKELIQPSHSAVLVIDVQNDACHPDGLYAKSGKDISLRRGAADKTADFINEARRYTVPIIFTKAIYSKWTETAATLRRREGHGPEPFLEGTWGAELYSVQPKESELVVVKPRYSAFIGTTLDLILRSKGIGTLIVTGGGAAVCVESTVRDGFMLDYNIILVTDCIGTTIVDEHIPALKRMASLCAAVLADAKEVLEVLHETFAQ